MITFLGSDISLPLFPQDQLLMNLIVEQMVCDRDPEVGSAVQLSGIIRILIDPDNMMAALNRSEKTEFFAFFYKHCMHSLVGTLEPGKL